ncbi:MAG TPA: hypothetical protein VN408_41040 [Actinoplanes sp.]|nr:hypothetical protein [Actinoplanes sp.]
MALLHKATIVPSKLELLNHWLPTRPWAEGAGNVERVAAGRFDDPAGAVGIETLILRAGDGRLLHVPLTYRDAPLDGAEQWLVGTTEHSVLGARWVYDAVGDPVYVAQLLDVIRSGGREAVEEFEVDGERQSRVPDLALRGSGIPAGSVRAAGAAGAAGSVDAVGSVGSVTDGDPVVIALGDAELTVIRVPGPVPPGETLTGAWDGDGSPAVLATLTAR